MTPRDYMEAARVPLSLEPQKFGDWEIRRLPLPLWLMRPGRRSVFEWAVKWEEYTALVRPLIAPLNWSNIHLEGAGGVAQKLDVVMEDSPNELSRHLPIWMRAHGRVLITGLGLGCVVRGLLASPKVTHIDVVEIDAGIIRVVGAEFAENPRVTIHQADALQFDLPGVNWHFAWHDIWTPGNEGLDLLHAELICRLYKRRPRVFIQGAWAFPRISKRMVTDWGFPLLGGRRPKGRAA